MVLFSFSIPPMISKIKDGSKHQTTRIPRKPRKNGEPAYKVGDKVQLYYRSRQHPFCNNCIIQPCPHQAEKDTMISGLKMNSCSEHTNFFGESEIIDIIHYHHGDYKERYHEIWMGHTLKLADEGDQESWAKADGFENWDQACDWFGRNETDKTKWYDSWADQNLDVIVWDKQPIIKRWQETEIREDIMNLETKYE